MILGPIDSWEQRDARKHSPNHTASHSWGPQLCNLRTTFKDTLLKLGQEVFFRKQMDCWQDGCQHFETPWNKASRAAGEKWNDRCNNASTTATVLTDTVRTTAVRTAHNDLTRPTFHRVGLASSSLPICKDCSIETIKHWCNQSPNGFFINIILTRTERVQTATSVSLLFNRY